MKKTNYLIGNAHLDPVWMWRWQEGYAEVKATFRSALDRMKEFPDFIFTCAAAATYKWLEECCPDMFAEIQARVKEGRWIIAGGWWIQPDCNLPSGESFVRHSLYAQQYFMEKFGVTAKVGYNVDSFGHNCMIPQILKKSGMNYYVFMRPGEHEKHLDSNVFYWQSPDGSRVLSYRIPIAYCCNFRTLDEMKSYMENSNSQNDKSIDEAMFFYGVGNHGGGPTKHNLELIYKLRADMPDNNFIFADPERYFKHLESKNYGIMTHTDDLQHHASGCYSACSMIKTLNRKCETALIAAEKYSVMSEKLTGGIYPSEKFMTAWENTLFNQFHDSLGGCSIKEVYDDAAFSAGESLSIAAKVQNLALQRLSWAADTTKYENPIVVFNPHPWEVKTLVFVNKCYNAVDDFDIQHVKSSSQSCTNRDDTLFEAVLPPLGYKTFNGHRETKNTENTLSITENTIENSCIKLVFEKYTGWITSIFDKVNNRELIRNRAAVPVVIDEFVHDTWSHARNFFTNEIAKFSDAVLTVIESGPVRATLKVVNRYNGSVLTQYFSLVKDSPLVRVRTDVDWHEKHKMLKLSYPLNVESPRAFYEIPYGVIERPCDGEEEPALQWIACKGEKFGAALLNDCKYSFSINDSDMRLTVVRSPIYGDHGGIRCDESVYTDQGAHEFNYVFMPFEGNFNDIIKSAQELNTPAVNIIENVHAGNLPSEYSGIDVDKDNIIVSVIKKAEDGNGYIVRAYETEGKACDALIKLSLLGIDITASFTPYEIKSLRVCNDGISECLLTEL